MGDRPRGADRTAEESRGGLDRTAEETRGGLGRTAEETRGADRTAGQTLGPWGAEMRPAPSVGSAAAVGAIVGGPGLLLTAVGWALWGPGVAAVAVVASAALLAAWVSLQPRRLLRGAPPLQIGSAPRLFNLVAGLATDLRMAAPVLHVTSSSGVNAFVCRHGGGHLGVTRGVLDSCTRTELEAIVAHCLVRLGRSRLRREALVAALGPLGRPLWPVVGAPEDVAAATVTSFPPALASAIRKADPVRRMAPFYFVARSPEHEDPEARAALVDDL